LEAVTAGLDHTQLLEEWRRRCTRWVRAHHHAARSFEFWETMLTLFNVLSSVSVFGASVAIAAEQKATPTYVWTVLIASGAALFMTLVQYILNMRATAHRHHHAATEYRAARRMIELAASSHADAKTIELVDEALRTAEKLAPPIPHRIWKRYVDGNHPLSSGQ
jgi:hypothetical protein